MFEYVLLKDLNDSSTDAMQLANLLKGVTCKINLIPFNEIDGKYKFVIIDSPPSLGLLTVNVLTAADSIIIPIQCEYYALEGLSQLLNSIRLVQKHLNADLNIEGILVTMYDNRLNLSRQVVNELKEYFNDKVYKSFIKRNVRLGEAPSHGKPILLYDASSTGAQNYMNLVSEILAANE